MKNSFISKGYSNFYGNLKAIDQCQRFISYQIYKVLQYLIDGMKAR
jgi:hypothetical protein